MITRRTMMATGAVGAMAWSSGASLLAQTPLGTPEPRVGGKIERLDPALDALIDATAEIEPLTENLVWCEGPTWVGGADGYLLYSDVRGNRIHRLNTNKQDTVWVDPSGYVGPLAPDVIIEAGTNGLYATRRGVIACDSGNRVVSLYDTQTKKRTVIADTFEGKRFNSPNDACISTRDGSIYFTDPPHGLTGGIASSARDMDYTGIFRIAANGKVTLIGKFALPNGIGISPDGGTLYHTDRTLGWLAHTLDRNGDIAATRVFIDRATVPGGDGLTIDSQGNMWTSSRGAIVIVTPDGRLLGKIVINNGVVSNCELGEDGYLYMSCNHQMARVKCKARKFAT